ncbi:glycosyltransferase [Porphyromonas levii]|uniref:glycosyltransferase n=1 Tax=Porphyromonas levii TaxID=28114 RepID=UPI001B8CE7C9|nr:glycosyltransferase [Porphyromonas levii]MBR8762946.1 GalNAc-alpha-(1->4)-GalNAc-alpha-(1->3)-diNAcBac-PP-undecaprenol alpha-1,4-N-acetyl-D-galactosaminyltransferase [Porphyromonas levii]MBR8769052.1 GalNAc-alpha-(1->4)-GalNAc-alpha-(1->3)-diNAcBac-PP-undecaprenol alpha-1,4-N-acetyl-D-galactosaminyltransferase [Porphyromonas levii]
MKVLFLIDNLGSGGAQRQVVTISGLLKAKGNDVTVLVYTLGDFFEPKLAELGIPLIKCIKKSHVSRVFSIRREIRRGKYDAVISFLDTPNFINNVSSLFGRKKWKVITSERSSKEDFMRSKKGCLFGWFQRFSDAIVCNSENARNMWRKHYPLYDKKLHCVYNAVSVEKPNVPYIPRKDGKTHIVVGASYQYMKNPIGLIKAVSLLPTEDRDRIRVDWYGRKYVNDIDKDLAFQESQALVDNLGLSEIVYLHDPTSELNAKMAEADFVGLFSELEGLPNTICEGMTLGKPIIMTKVSDYVTLVDEDNGFLCDWDNIDSIRRVLLQAKNVSDGEIEEMGNHSYKRSLRLFSLSIIADMWEQIIIGK